jgi:hypothetical protein
MIEDIKGDIFVSLFGTGAAIRIPDFNVLTVFDEWRKTLTQPAIRLGFLKMQALSYKLYHISM